MKLRFSKSLISLLIYLMAGVLFLNPLLKYGTTEISSVGFICGVFLVVLTRRNIFSLYCYFFIVMCNIHMSYVPMIYLNGLTVNGFIKIIVIVGIMCSAFLTKGFKKYIGNQDIRTYLLWILAAIFINIINAVVFKSGATSMLLRLDPIYFSVLVIIAIGKDDRNLDEIMIAIIASAILFTVVAYIELIQDKTFFYSIWTGEERYRNGILRVGSTLEDSNILGLFLLPSIFIICTNKVKKLIGKNLSYVLVILMIIMLLLTSSRMSLIAFLIAMIVLLYLQEKSNKRLLGLFGGFIGICMIPAFLNRLNTYEVASTGQRFYLVKKAITFWLQKPVFGIGMSEFQRRTTWLTMNEFVRQLVEFGIFAVVIYCLFYILFLHLFSKKTYMFDLSRKHDASCILAAIIAFMINSLTLDTYYYYILWVLPALALYFFGCYSKKKD